jgi:signal transduction histidine kinase
VARLTRWAWAADVVLAALLAVGTLIADLDRSVTQDVPASAVFPAPRPGQVPPAPPLPAAGEDATWAPAPPFPPPPAPSLGPAELWELALAVLIAVPLVVRRPYPLVAFWAVLGAMVLFHQGEITQDAAAFAFVAGLIAAYSAAMYSPRRKAVAASLLAGTVLFTAFRLVPDVGQGFIPVLVLLPLGLAANAMHAWQQRARALREEQAAATRRAVERERSRIARELHDVVTHNVSVMTIQAGAARKVLDTAPDQAREAMRAVEAGGRAAMSELRHVMGLLTMAADSDADGLDPAATADLAPQPGLRELPSLASRVRDTGVPVELTVTGDPAPLPAGVDLTAYRVVQEALTNVVKHAAGARVSVTVDHAPGQVRVEVADTGGLPTAEAGTGSGRGMIGLRERLAVYGGTLHAGRSPVGGFRVRAVIPVDAVDAVDAVETVEAS